MFTKSSQSLYKVLVKNEFRSYNLQDEIILAAALNLFTDILHGFCPEFSL